jgi:hypothetical protein
MNWERFAWLVLVFLGLVLGAWWGHSRAVASLPEIGENTPRKGVSGDRQWVWVKYEWPVDEVFGDPPCIIEQQSADGSRWDEVITVHGYVDDYENAETIVAHLRGLRGYRIRMMGGGE